MNLRTSLKALVLIIPFALAACASQQEASSEKDIVDTAVEAGQFNTRATAPSLFSHRPTRLLQSCPTARSKTSSSPRIRISLWRS
jgi:hypothetical protein